jgi:hypothetical protein
LVEKNIEPKTPGNFIPGIIKVETYKTEKGKAGKADSDTDVSSMNILSDPVVTEHYFVIYELAHYECGHLFDPDLGCEDSTPVRGASYESPALFKSLQS